MPSLATTPCPMLMDEAPKTMVVAVLFGVAPMELVVISRAVEVFGSLTMMGTDDATYPPLSLPPANCVMLLVFNAQPPALEKDNSPYACVCVPLFAP